MFPVGIIFTHPCAFHLQRILTMFFPSRFIYLLQRLKDSKIPLYRIVLSIIKFAVFYCVSFMAATLTSIIFPQTFRHLDLQYCLSYCYSHCSLIYSCINPAVGCSTQQTIIIYKQSINQSIKSSICKAPLKKVLRGASYE